MKGQKAIICSALSLIMLADISPVVVGAVELTQTEITQDHITAEQLKVIKEYALDKEVREHGADKLEIREEDGELVPGIFKGTGAIKLLEIFPSVKIHSGAFEDCNIEKILLHEDKESENYRIISEEYKGEIELSSLVTENNSGEVAPENKEPEPENVEPEPENVEPEPEKVESELEENKEPEPEKVESELGESKEPKPEKEEPEPEKVEPVPDNEEPGLEESKEPEPNKVELVSEEEINKLLAEIRGKIAKINKEKEETKATPVKEVKPIKEKPPVKTSVVSKVKELFGFNKKPKGKEKVKEKATKPESRPEQKEEESGETENSESGPELIEKKGASIEEYKKDKPLTKVEKDTKAKQESVVFIGEDKEPEIIQELYLQKNEEAPVELFSNVSLMSVMDTRGSSDYISAESDFTYEFFVSDKGGKAVVTGFSDAGKKKLQRGITKVKLPGSARDKNTRKIYPVTIIRHSSFLNSKLTSVDFSRCTRLETIGNHVFSDNTLTSVDLSKCTNLQEIGASSFEGNKITSVNLGGCSKLQVIGVYAFHKNKLTSLKLRGCRNLQVVWGSAFQGNRLTSVDFSDCTNLKEIEQKAFEGNPIEELDLSKCPKLENIGSKAFHCMSIRKVNLVDCNNLKTIGKQAFSPNLIDSISFRGCSNLISIGEGAFALNNITSIDFTGCNKLKTIGNAAFASIPVIGLDLSKCPSLERIGISAFYATELDNNDLSRLTKLKYIGKNAFKVNASKQNPLRIANSVTTFDLDLGQGAVVRTTAGNNPNKLTCGKGCEVDPKEVTDVKLTVDGIPTAYAQGVVSIINSKEGKIKVNLLEDGHSTFYGIEEGSYVVSVMLIYREFLYINTDYHTITYPVTISAKGNVNTDKHITVIPSLSNHIPIHTNLEGGGTLATFNSKESKLKMQATVNGDKYSAIPNYLVNFNPNGGEFLLKYSYPTTSPDNHKIVYTINNTKGSFLLNLYTGEKIKESLRKIPITPYTWRDSDTWGKEMIKNAEVLSRCGLNYFGGHQYPYKVTHDKNTRLYNGYEVETISIKFKQDTNTDITSLVDYEVESKLKDAYAETPAKWKKVSPSSKIAKNVRTYTLKGINDYRIVQKTTTDTGELPKNPIPVDFSKIVNFRDNKGVLTITNRTDSSKLKGTLHIETMPTIDGHTPLYNLSGLLEGKEVDLHGAGGHFIETITNGSSEVTYLPYGNYQFNYISLGCPFEITPPEVVTVDRKEVTYQMLANLDSKKLQLVAHLRNEDGGRVVAPAVFHIVNKEDYMPGTISEPVFTFVGGANAEEYLSTLTGTEFYVFPEFKKTTNTPYLFSKVKPIKIDLKECQSTDFDVIVPAKKVAVQIKPVASQLDTAAGNRVIIKVRHDANNDENYTKEVEVTKNKFIANALYNYKITKTIVNSRGETVQTSARYLKTTEIISKYNKGNKQIDVAVGKADKFSNVTVVMAPVLKNSNSPVYLDALLGYVSGKVKIENQYKTYQATIHNGKVTFPKVLQGRYTITVEGTSSIFNKPNPKQVTIDQTSETQEVQLAIKENIGKIRADVVDENGKHIPLPVRWFIINKNEYTSPDNFTPVHTFIGGAEPSEYLSKINSSEFYLLLNLPNGKEFDTFAKSEVTPIPVSISDDLTKIKYTLKSKKVAVQISPIASKYDNKDGNHTEITVTSSLAGENNFNKTVTATGNKYTASALNDYKITKTIINADGETVQRHEETLTSKEIIAKYDSGASKITITVGKHDPNGTLPATGTHGIWFFIIISAISITFSVIVSLLKRKNKK